MNTLGWQSLEVLRANLDWEELQVRSAQAGVGFIRHMHDRNGPLFERWYAEHRSCTEEKQRMLRQFEQYKVFTSSSVGNHDFAELQKKHPGISTTKEHLEFELLKLAQREEECLRATRAADRLDRSRDPTEEQRLRASILRACQAFDTQHERCVELLEQFRRNYLD